MTYNQIAYNEHLENKRHNIATENETYRHNVTGEIETHRHNVVYETETQRHNLQTELLGFMNLAETKRHNVQTEQISIANLNETVRHNQQTEAVSWFTAHETRRHNLADESIGRTNAAANMINAVTNRARQVTYSQVSRADIAKTHAETAYIKNQSDLYYGNYMVNFEKTASQTRLNEIEEKYAGQENARRWVNSIFGALGAAAKVAAAAG